MPVSTKSFTYGRKKKRIELLKKHLKSASESAIINKQRVAFLRKSSWRNSHAPFFAESGEKWQDGRKLHRQIV